MLRHTAGGFLGDLLVCSYLGGFPGDLGVFPGGGFPLTGVLSGRAAWEVGSVYERELACSFADHIPQSVS